MKCAECGADQVKAKGLCPTCYFRQWRHANREKHLAARREWAASNPDKTAAMRHKWYEAHAEEECRKAAQWRRDNPEKLQVQLQRRNERRQTPAARAAQLAYNRQWRERNPDKVKASQERHRRRYAIDPALSAEAVQRMKRWAITHPERYQDACRRAHYRRRLRLGELSLVEQAPLLAIYERERGQCHICKKRVPLREATLDHIVPVYFGGEHSMRNLRIAHRRCNSRRGIRGPGQPYLL